jgi:hypothetical protein
MSAGQWRNFARDVPGQRLTAAALQAGTTPASKGDATTDSDHDGLPDAAEASLASRYAPTVVLAPDETHRPASIAWLLGRVTLPGDGFGSQVRAGSGDPRDWVTYVHVFPRPDGRIELQYWFFYPFNDGPLLLDHEGDWEHVTVDVALDGTPLAVAFAQHHDNHPGPTRAWAAVRRDADHPIVLSARGTHASYADQASVRWFERASHCGTLVGCADPIWRTWEAGGLVNMGERGAELGARPAFTYAGRWGSSGHFPWLRPAPFGPMLQRGF